MRPPLTADEIASFRARICEVAERLFAERGVPAVSMRELATALGRSATAAYRYFRDKEEILAAVRTAAFDRFADRMETAMAAARGARARGLALGRAHLDFVAAEPHAYRLMFDLTQPDEARYPELQRAAARTTRVMTSWVEELLAEGIVRGDPIQLAHVFWAASHGLAVLHLAGKLPPGFDLLGAQRETMRLLARGTRYEPRAHRAAGARAGPPADGARERGAAARRPAGTRARPPREAPARR
jgi:AcrR family transcriptional regulator